MPTYFQETEIAEIPQQIVNTYGIPNYKEANPALFTVVTFPFLFGVMFGDVFHGSLLLGFALWLYSAGEKKVGLMLYQCRHFLALMGIFATFCGFCYNDYTSVPLYLFGKSCYEIHHGKATLDEDCVYPIGIDPTWYLSVQELQFMNSVKMKLAVIFGVAQMSLGICLKGSNNLYYH